MFLALLQPLSDGRLLEDWVHHNDCLPSGLIGHAHKSIVGEVAPGRVGPRLLRGVIPCAGVVALLLQLEVGRVGERRDRFADPLRGCGIHLQDVEGR